MKTFEISVLTTIRSVPSLEWNALERRRNLYLSHAWLDWAEGDSGATARYVVAHDANNQLVGALPIYLVSGIEGSWNSWYDPLTVFAAADADTPARRNTWFPLLVLGSLSGYQSDLLLNDCLGADARLEVIAALLARCSVLAEQWSTGSMAAMYLPEPEAKAIAHALPGSTGPILTSASAVLSATWQSVTGYLDSFPRRRRYNLQREIAVFESSGSQVHECRLSECVDLVGPLLGNVHRKHGADDSDGDTTKYLESQAAHLDEISHVFIEMADGRPVGFSLCYEWGSRLYVRVVGFDYERSARFSYFNLAYYLPLRYAIQRGLASIDVGPGTYAAKAARGARLSPTWSVVRPADAESRAWFERAHQVGEDAREAAPWLRPKEK